MERKETELKNFFAEMERNILKKMQHGLVGPQMSSVEVMESPGSILTEPTADCTVSSIEDGIQESWVQSWIDSSTPSLTLDSPTLSQVSSSGSITSCEDERDDLIMPLKKSQLSINKAINKPKLIRTISKMEYDLTLLLQGTDTNSNDVDLLSAPDNGDVRDLFASLRITHEPEGVGCELIHPLKPPLSPGNTSVSSIETDNTGPSCDLTKPHLTRRNTCGTIYLGSTLSTPDKDALIKCVCGVYRAHLLQSENDVELRDADRIFDDDYSSLQKQYHPSIPTLEDITDFYRDIFLRSQMEVDCIVISLIYIERLIKLTSGRLHPAPFNWKSLLFSCMVLASKVWDDLSMWNSDFSKIGPGGMTFTLQRTNELEIALLTALEYKVKVGASEYAKYYFLLRSMLCRSGLANDNLTSMNPLDTHGMKSLEGTGASFCDLGVTKPFLRSRSKSFGDLEKREEEEEAASDSTYVGGSLRMLSHKISLEHLVRM